VAGPSLQPAWTSTRPKRTDALSATATSTWWFAGNLVATGVRSRAPGRCWCWWRDRDRTCAFCRVKETRPHAPPQLPMRCTTPSQLNRGGDSRSSGAALRVTRRRLWQVRTDRRPRQAGAVVAHRAVCEKSSCPDVHGVVGRPRLSMPATRGAYPMPIPPRVSVVASGPPSWIDRQRCMWRWAGSGRPRPRHVPGI
jgi:hypothetical protein